MKMLLPGILFGAALILGAAIAYEAFAPLDPVLLETPQPPPRHASAIRPIAYAPPSQDLFADIDARPLFSAQRRPLQDMTQAAGGATAATSDFVLVGVIMGGQRAVALLRNKSTSATTSAALGDLVAGWRVTRIDATTVTLRANGGEFVVPLDGPANHAPSAPLQAEQPVPAPAPQPQAVTPSPAQPPPTQPLPAQAVSNTTHPKPALPAHPPGGTISPEALKGAPIDPSTGQPTL